MGNILSFVKGRLTAKTLIVGGIVGVMAISIALAAVNIGSGVSPLFASTQTVAANSQPVGLFELNLSQTAGETLSSITVRVNSVASSTVASSDIANVAVYKDNGDGNFNPASDLLAGSQTSVAINADTAIATTVNNSINTTTGKFFVSLRTSGTWSSISTPDAITVTFPATGLVVGNPTSTIALSAVVTPVIRADSVGPVLTSVVAQDSAATPTKTVGDTLVFSFNEATNKPAITTATVDTALSVNNGHSLKNGGSTLGVTSWNGAGTALTLTLNDNGFGVPTVAIGDMVAALGGAVTDVVGNSATGSATVTGTFGAGVVTKLGSTITTDVRNASNASITSVVFGTAVHDYATVVGVGSTTIATGTASFTLYNNSTCNGSVLSTQNVALVSGNASSNATSTLAIGSYSYKASYAGNNLYNASAAVCEPFSISATAINLTPIISSNIQNTSNTSITGQTVITGTVVHDYAVISGSNGTPTGNVDFMRYTNGTCSGDPATTENNIALNGIGAAASSNFATVAGMMSYRVHYDGNGTYLPLDGSCKSLTVKDHVPPVANGNCTNGLINGRLYMVTGKSKIFLAAACRLKEFKGNAVGHAHGKKFQDIIPLPAASVDDNGNIVKTFTIIMLDKKPVTIRTDAGVKHENEKKKDQEKKQQNVNKDNESKNKGNDDHDNDGDDD